MTIYAFTFTPQRSHGRRPLPREHGTERGFQQHRWQREQSCDECKAAHSRHVMAQRRAS